MTCQGIVCLQELDLVNTIYTKWFKKYYFYYRDEELLTMTITTIMTTTTPWFDPDDDGDTMLLFVRFIAVDCRIRSSKLSRQLRHFGKSGNSPLYARSLRRSLQPAAEHKAPKGK